MCSVSSSCLHCQPLLSALCLVSQHQLCLFGSPVLPCLTTFYTQILLYTAVIIFLQLVIRLINISPCNTPHHLTREASFSKNGAFVIQNLFHLHSGFEENREEILCIILTIFIGQRKTERPRLVRSGVALSS